MKVEVVLTGSQRTERPIKVLVEALEQLSNNFLEKWAIRLFESKTEKDNGLKVNIPANVSSQYISALMLVAKIRKRIEINLVGEITRALH
jgi:3-phosphoshikimate 1-carboxyvinyltransferase